MSDEIKLNPDEINNVGFFHSRACLGYVEPSDEEVKKFIAGMTFPVCGYDLLDLALAIKLLAPEQAKNIRLFDHLHIRTLLDQARTNLITNYRRR